MFGGIFKQLGGLLLGASKVDDALLDELEEMLVRGDVGGELAMQLTDEVREQVEKRNLQSGEQVRDYLKLRVKRLVQSLEGELKVGPTSPTVYLFVGVNGTGKTTTIGKLAYRLTSQGKKVLLAAGDTFRAAAIEQLEIWANRAGADIVKHKEGADPGAVLFDAIQAAKARGSDYVIADTAGRLHTKQNLMTELAKVERICERELGRKPDEVVLVLDATTGQNAIQQAKQFRQAVEVTALVLAKLDSSAKAGAVLSIAKELQLPVKLVGLGEGIEKLEPFDPELYASGLFEV